VAPYYNRPPQRGIVAHFEAVAAATDRPVIAYNIPLRVVVNIEPPTIARLAEIENVRAVKQAYDDLAQARHIVETGLDLYAGDDNILQPFLELGAVGGICVHTHVVGPQVKEMITRYKAGGRAYICIPNFKKHQHPHPNEPKSVIPPAKARSARDNVRRTYDKGGSARDKVVSARVLPSFNLSPGFHDNSFLEKKKEEEDLRAHVPRDDPEDPPPPDLFSEEFFDNLQDQKKFRHLDVRDVHQKWKNHCEATGKEPTPEYFLNWLNRERGDLRNAGSDEEIARIVARLS
jgi:hypothetical protein